LGQGFCSRRSRRRPQDRSYPRRSFGSSTGSVLTTWATAPTSSTSPWFLGISMRSSMSRCPVSRYLRSPPSIILKRLLCAANVLLSGLTHGQEAGTRGFPIVPLGAGYVEWALVFVRTFVDEFVAAAHCLANYQMEVWQEQP